MTSQAIKYHKKSVYGNEMLYITDAEQARAVQALTGQKTISQRIIDALKMLGVECVHVPVN